MRSDKKKIDLVSPDMAKTGQLFYFVGNIYIKISFFFFFPLTCTSKHILFLIFFLLYMPKKPLSGSVNHRIYWVCPNGLRSIDNVWSNQFLFIHKKRYCLYFHRATENVSQRIVVPPDPIRQTPESPPPPPDRVLEPPASPEPSERGNPPRRTRDDDSRSSEHRSRSSRSTSQPRPEDMNSWAANIQTNHQSTAIVEARDSPLSPPPADQHAVSDE